MDNENKKMSAKKSRFFACVSYITDTDIILNCIQLKSNSVRSFAVIKHDKDDADTHHHMVIRTNSTWTCPQVAKWFKDENGQNTFVQPVIDRNGIIEYLTHENEENKYKYDKADIIDGGLEDLLPKCDCTDDSFEIIDQMLRGVPTRELVRLYGRDFIYHFGSYQVIVQAIKEEEGM